MQSISDELRRNGGDAVMENEADKTDSAAAWSVLSGGEEEKARKSPGGVSGKAAVERAKSVSDMAKSMAADAVLSSFRRLLWEAEDEDSFDEIAKGADSLLKAELGKTASDKAFWEEHGGNIIDANQKDIAKIREARAADFGKKGLLGMLSQSQNLLVSAGAKKAGLILEHVANEIEQSPFLSGDEKKRYHDEYLKSGLLNLALSDTDAARELAEKYEFDGKDGLNAKINETERLKKEWQKEQKAKGEETATGARVFEAASLWQEYERGNMSPAAFYVLSADDDNDMLWGTHEKRSQTPLYEAYKIVKKLNSGEALKANELGDAVNYLISAYRDKKIGFEEAAALQNQLLMARGGKTEVEMLFTKEVDGLADRVLLRDFFGDVKNDAAGAAFMEEKARFSFGLFEDYYSRKTALEDEFAAQGGVVTADVEKRLKKQALAEVVEEAGFKENAGGALSFSDLRRGLKNVYTGVDEAEIWRRFYKEAPYVEDKKGLFLRIAKERQQVELNYPRFESEAEVFDAGLEKGDRFYLRGRLAEWA